MSASEILVSERRDGVLRLTLNRPERRNALNDDLIRALTAAFAGIAGDTSIRAALLTATGEKAFCAGADLNPQAGTFGFDYATPSTSYAELLRTARRAPVPVIGRINGHCLAGGMGLLAICDMAVAAAHAKFGLPEVKVGVFPMQVAALLQPMIPPRDFARLCYTGAMIDAAEAQRIGLINAAADDLDAAVDALLAEVLAVSPTATRRGKHALSLMTGMTPDQALAYMEAQVGLMPLTEDAQEGLKAFAEKRAPVWTGR